MILKAKQTNRYGTEVIKPVSPELVDFLSAIGKKELTQEYIKALSLLGIAIEIN
tara:strand:+ start:584 stop:745 length:162 start_codon:yes stop_codon:yes gene_type:complete